MTAIAFKDACYRFAQAAAPYLPIKDERHYQEALELIETLLEEAADCPDDPLNSVIDVLAGAISAYESQDPALSAFEANTENGTSDIAVLRLLMDQHGLGTADLPEIGSKSMVSRVLSGERQLNKYHIKALSERFQLSPSLFF